MTALLVRERKVESCGKTIENVCRSEEISNNKSIGINSHVMHDSNQSNCGDDDGEHFVRPESVVYICKLQYPSGSLTLHALCDHVDRFVAERHGHCRQLALNRAVHCLDFVPLIEEVERPVDERGECENTTNALKIVKRKTTENVHESWPRRSTMVAR